MTIDSNLKHSFDVFEITSLKFNTVEFFDKYFDLIYSSPYEYINEIIKLKNRIIKERLKIDPKFMPPARMNCPNCIGGIILIKRNILLQKVKCTFCNGSGIKTTKCGYCKGSGWKRDNNGNVTLCKVCNGSGKYIFHQNFKRESVIKCKYCKGKGYTQDFKVQILTTNICSFCNGKGYLNMNSDNVTSIAEILMEAIFNSK